MRHRKRKVTRGVAEGIIVFNYGDLRHDDTEWFREMVDMLMEDDLSNDARALCDERGYRYPTKEFWDGWFGMKRTKDNQAVTIERIYVCDGNADGCLKKYCKFNGSGGCEHTSQREHARYDPPRKWRKLWHLERAFNRNVYIEIERDEGAM